MRARLIENQDELIDQEGKLVNTKKMGLETAGLMQQANQALYGQRNIIKNVGDLDQEIK